jgi:DNA-binding GntR family transcriptional regulator
VNLRVTAEARALRRAVGVTAWCVLEELVMDASVDARGRFVASTNVRRLAASLGVSKDTAARAVARLVRAGVVERNTNARGERGTFPTAVYVIDVERVAGLTIDLVDDVPEHEPTRVTPPRTRTRSRHVSRVDDDQASLFDLPASAS